MSRRLLSTFFAATLLMAFIPAIIVGQRGDPKSASNSRAASMFDRMAKSQGNKEYLDISKMPVFMRSRIEEFARSKGIKDGKLRKELFIEFSEAQQKRLDKLREGASKAKPPATKSGSDPKSTGKKDSSSSRDAPKDSREERLEKMLDTFFQRSDKNKDGNLDKSEMSENLQKSFKKYDKDNDGKINYKEARAYIHGWAEQRFGGRFSEKKKSIRPPQPIKITIVNEKILDGRPVVYRAGVLPKGLPEWFLKADTDGDGQIGLYEWRTTGKDLNEFNRFDRNGDGFLTLEEMDYYQKYVAETETKKPSSAAVSLK